ncbi:MAG: CocE/NonD family hydrolase [Pseudomonadota bacterium]
MLRRFVLFVYVVISGIGNLQSGVSEARAKEPAHKPIDVLLQQKIPAPDGTLLAATVWKPDADDKKYTAILVVTPYVSDEAQSRARLYADRGYAMVSLDRRSRGASGGDYEILTNVGPDACAAIDWIKAQPWSDGLVAMRGGSYRGMTQWMTASTCPEKLETIIPTASVYPGHDDFPLGRGLGSYKYIAQWLSFVAGPTNNFNLFADQDYWHERTMTSYRTHLPFHQYDAFVGHPSPVFQGWVETLSDPAKWDVYTIAPEVYGAMDLPILSITGHYDGDQGGALGYFRQHQESAPRSKRRQHYLVMGPWDHSGTRAPRQKLSDDTEFAPNAAFDMDQFNMEWFDWQLGRGPKPTLLRKGRIAYYMGGVNEWRHAEDLDAITQRTQTLFISAQPDEAYDVFRSGQLAANATDNETPHSFKSDPLDISRADTTDGSLWSLSDSKFRDVWPAHMPETLVFHSAALEEAMSVAGQMRLTLYLEIDTPDTDIFATVYAILPDGEPLHLGNDIVRARFRNGLTPQMVKPGTIEPYVFDGFAWNAWKLPVGTRLRLTVGPFNDPYFQKNYNSGGRLGFETAEDARIATIRLHHNIDHPSALEIPLTKD